jgi:peptidoglycan-N-acetylglucosamine deacetylase
MKCGLLLIAILTGTLFFAANAQTKKAIICLTYDDALESQLKIVVPQLDSAGLKATFFLTSIQGSSSSEKIGQSPEAVLGWVNAAKHGHELANHTLFHPCPEKLGWDKAVALDSYTVDRIVQEIETQTTLLSLLDPGRKLRSYAFPCNNFLIGDTDYSKIIKEKGLATFARAGGDSTSVITNFKELNTMKVPSWQVWTGTTLKQLIDFAEKVKKAGGMGVYQFHGVGGQIFAISSEDHKAFLNYLKVHEKDFWVTTFSEAMEYVTKKL